MKKLLLFIVVLFGMLSVQSLSDGEYCSVGQCRCPNGGIIAGGQYCPTNNYYEPPVPKATQYYYIFAYDKDTGAYGAAERTKKKWAVEEAVKECGTANCKIIFSSKKSFEGLAVAASSNGVVVTQTEGGYDELARNALEKCAEQNGINCKLIWTSWDRVERKNNKW